MDAGEAEEIRRAVIAMVSGLIPLNTAWCQVRAVNDQTCNVLHDDLLIENILLGYDKSGVIIYPSINSDVLVAFINNTKNVGAVIMAEKTDKVDILGNANGGVPKITPLNDELAKLNQNFTILKNATAAAISTLSAAIDGGVTSTAFNTALSGIQLQDLTQIENIKVRTGNG